MGKPVHDLKSLGLGFLLLVLVAFSIIAAVASMKFGGIFVIAGILDLVVVGYAAYVFFKKYLDVKNT